MNKTPTIVLTGGGSGGHITPLLSLARELKKQSPGCRIVYVGQKGDDLDKLKKSGGDFDFMVFIKAGKFRRYYGNSFIYHFIKLKTLLLNIRDLSRLPGSVAASYRLLGRFGPDVVFSKGGFVAFPVGLAAKLRHIPIITHDSDVVPGLANLLVGRWAKLHTTGLPPEFYDYPKHSIEYVGIPIDDRIKKVTPKLQKQYKRQLKIPEDSKLLLLSGGGNGSVPLNDLMVSVAPHLLETNLSLYIVHLTGAAHLEPVTRAYRHLLPKQQRTRVRAEGFSLDFYALSAAADLIITRAGATTLAELAAAGKACVIIPSPYLAGGHQLRNAEELAKHQAAVVLEQGSAPDELLAVINELLNDDHRRFELARNLFGTARPQAAARLAEIILNRAGA